VTEQLVLRLHALPFAVFSVVLIALASATVVLRGDRLIRLAILIVALATLPWAASLALAGSTHDPVLAERFFRAGSGTIGLIGAGLLLLILAVSGRIAYHRWLLVSSFACAFTTCLLEWTTELMVAGVQMTRSGMWYAKAGPLNVVNVGQIVVWGVVGVLVARQGNRGSRDHRRSVVQRTLIILVITISGTFDLLLALGIVRLYPMAWLPGIVASVLAMHAMLRTDLLQDRGIDRAGAVELAALAAAAAGVFAVAWVLDQTGLASPLALSTLAAPLSAGAMGLGIFLRARQWPREPVAIAAERELELFAESAHAANSDQDVIDGLSALLERHAGLSGVRLWRSRGDQLVPLGTARPLPLIDDRVRAWLVANPEPLVAAEIGTLRMGPLRGPIERFVTGLDVDVIIPLVDRDALVGLAAAQLTAGRPLRVGDRELVTDAATAGARALTFVALTIEAAALEGTAREVEVAEAVQAARAGNDVRVDVGAWRIALGYQPAARIAGDVWSWAALPGERLLVVLADVVGRGVPAALVSAAVAGACEAAAGILGPDPRPEDLLRLLHDTVREIGAGEQRAGACAVLLDPYAGVVRYATAGHRGGYLVRPRAAGAAVISPLAARGTQLGDAPSLIGSGIGDLHGDDWLVLISDGVVDVRDDAGRALGERRVLRALRDWMSAADDRAAELLLHEATGHAGPRPIDDDLVVLTVRRRVRPPTSH
jgi:phosphoserine phosphatase RsbU/P